MTGYYGRRSQLANPFHDQPQQSSIGQQAMAAAFGVDYQPPPPSGGMVNAPAGPRTPLAQAGQLTVPGSPRVPTPPPPARQAETPAASTRPISPTGQPSLTNAHYYGATADPSVRDWRVQEITNYYNQYIGRQPSPQELAKHLTNPKFDIHNIHRTVVNSPEALTYAMTQAVSGGGLPNNPRTPTTGGGTPPSASLPPPAGEPGYGDPGAYTPGPGGPPPPPEGPPIATTGVTVDVSGKIPQMPENWMSGGATLPYAPTQAGWQSYWLAQHKGAPGNVADPVTIGGEAVDPAADPAAEDPSTLPPVMPGWDATKWSDPNHNTEKYVVGRILSRFPHTPEGLAAAFEEIKKIFPNATFDGKDVLDMGMGNGPIDVLVGADLGGQGWAWQPVGGGDAGTPAGTPGGEQAGGVDGMMAALLGGDDAPRFDAMNTEAAGQGSYSSAIIQYLLRQLAMGNSLFPAGAR